MEVRPGYKQPNGGVIPEQWKIASLKQVAEVGAGINKPVSEMGTGALYVTVQDLYDGTSIRTSRLGRIKVTLAELERKSLAVGDIVFGKSSVKRDGIGYPSQFWGCAEPVVLMPGFIIGLSPNGVTNIAFPGKSSVRLALRGDERCSGSPFDSFRGQGDPLPGIWGCAEPVVYSGFTYRARARQGTTDPTFLFYALRADETRRWIIDNSQSSALTNINQTIADAIPIRLPQTLSEQRAIATALSDVDALLGGLDRLIAKKRDLKQAAMQQLLTGQTRLSGFSGEWETKRLGDLLAYERPDRYIVKSTEYSNHGDIPVLTANKAFILGYTTEAFGVCADLPAIVFDDFTTDSKFATAPFKVKSSAIKLLRPRYDRTSLRFLFDRMQLIRFPVGDHKRYYISDYQNIRLPIPESDEQLAVVSVLSDMDAELAALEARRDKTRDLKQAMMQELLTGKTRLVAVGGAPA